MWKHVRVEACVGWKQPAGLSVAIHSRRRKGLSFGPVRGWRRDNHHNHLAPLFPNRLPTGKLTLATARLHPSVMRAEMLPPL